MLAGLAVRSMVTAIGDTPYPRSEESTADCRVSCAAGTGGDSASASNPTHPDSNAKIGADNPRSPISFMPFNFMPFILVYLSF